ncbi:MAG: helix-turn-helix domain-containing protein, partial [Acidimicrobiales bacterium]
MATSTAIRKDRHIKTSVLGELLSANRAACGLTLEALSSRSGFTVDQIVEVESGRHDLEAPALERLLASYEIPAMTKRRSRLSVEISLDGGWVALGAGRRSQGKLPEADENLLSYLCLVYRDRDLSLHDRIPLKTVDLSLLRASLAIRRPEVRSRLDRQRNTV